MRVRESIIEVKKSSWSLEVINYFVAYMHY